MTRDGFEENDKKAEPSLEIDGLEETADEVEYEPVREGEAFAEKKDRTGAGPHGEEEKGLKPKLKKKEAEIKALKKETMNSKTST